jgi:hypothetical protein
MKRLNKTKLTDFERDLIEGLEGFVKDKGKKWSLPTNRETKSKKSFTAMAKRMTNSVNQSMQPYLLSRMPFAHTFDVNAELTQLRMLYWVARHASVRNRD